VGCRVISQLSRKDTDQAFTIGLMHDIGKPVLAWILDEVIQEHFRGRADFNELAPEIFHLLHGRVGATIVRHWKLPNKLAAIVAHHHDPAPPPKLRQALRMLRLANLLYETWRSTRKPMHESEKVRSHPRIARAFDDPHKVERMVRIYPAALENLLAA